MARLVFHQVSLFDGLADELVSDAVVVTERDRITAVGRRREFGASLPAGVSVDGGGGVLMPGLINCHEHQDTRGATGSYQERVAQDTHYLVLRTARNGLLNLAAGITAVRDMASRDGISLIYRDAVASGLVRGPRVVACGQAIAMTGGHGHLRALVADGADAVRAAARALIRRGADLIKCMASGGVVEAAGDLPASPQFTVEELRAAFDEAHAAGCPTAAHAHPSEAIRRAVEAGVDCVEHAMLLDAPTADLMAARGVYLVPTLSEGPAMVSRGPSWGRPAAVVERARALLDRHALAARLAVGAGVVVAAGTDVMGEMPEEVELLREAGLSAAASLRAATSVAARIIGRASDLGVIAAGYLADLIITDGNPLINPGALRRIRWVCKGGELYDPVALRAAAGRVPA